MIDNEFSFDSKFVSYPSYDNTTSLTNEVAEFVSLIKNKKTHNRSDINLSINVTKIISMAEQSIRNNGKQIKIN
jgi:hypothetical protein